MTTKSKKQFKDKTQLSVVIDGKNWTHSKLNKIYNELPVTGYDDRIFSDGIILAHYEDEDVYLLRCIDHSFVNIKK